MSASVSMEESHEFDSCNVQKSAKNPERYGSLGSFALLCSIEAGGADTPTTSQPRLGSLMKSCELRVFFNCLPIILLFCDISCFSQVMWELSRKLNCIARFYQQFSRLWFRKNYRSTSELMRPAQENSSLCILLVSFKFRVFHDDLSNYHYNY